jgi:hypothetical protein
MEDIIRYISKDKGLEELVRSIASSHYATGQIQYKKHKQLVGQYTAYEARTHKIEGWSNLIGYVAELGKWCQADAEPKTRHKITFTIEVNEKGEVERLTEDDYKTKHFDIRP